MVPYRTGGSVTAQPPLSHSLHNGQEENVCVPVFRHPPCRSHVELGHEQESTYEMMTLLFWQTRFSPFR